MEPLQSGEHEPPTLVTAIQNSSPEHLGSDGQTGTHEYVPTRRSRACMGLVHSDLSPARSQGQGSREAEGAELRPPRSPQLAPQVLPWAHPSLQPLSDFPSVQLPSPRFLASPLPLSSPPNLSDPQDLSYAPQSFRLLGTPSSASSTQTAAPLGSPRSRSLSLPLRSRSCTQSRPPLRYSGQRHSLSPLCHSTCPPHSIAGVSRNPRGPWPSGPCCSKAGKHPLF